MKQRGNQYNWLSFIYAKNEGASQSNNTREEFNRLRDEFIVNMVYQCSNCGHDEDLHMHHIVPLALGGTNRITNMSLLCGSCHSKVHGKTSLYYVELQREGIERAKAEGRHLGRPAIELPNEWNYLYKQWKAEQIKAVEFMEKISMKKATFYKKVKEYEQQMTP